MFLNFSQVLECILTTQQFSVQVFRIDLHISKVSLCFSCRFFLDNGNISGADAFDSVDLLFIHASGNLHVNRYVSSDFI